MTVIIPEPDETPASDDTTVVVAPVIVNDTGGNDDDAAANEIVEPVVEAVVEETVDLAVQVGQLSERVLQLELAQAVTAVEDETPDVIVNEEGDGDVIVTGDNSPVGVPWTHKKPSFFGGN